MTISTPEGLIVDMVCGSIVMLNRPVHECGVKPHITRFDKSRRRAGTFCRGNFACDRLADRYTCPATKSL